MSKSDEINDNAKKRKALHETEEIEIEQSMQFEDDDDIDIDIMGGDDDESDGDGNMLMVVSQASVVEQQRIPDKPPDDLVWDDSVIMNCWNMTLDSYAPNNQTVKVESPPTAQTPEESEAEKEKIRTLFEKHQWKAPKLQRKGELSNEAKKDDDASAIADALKDWTPRPLPIPSWAIDPVEVAKILPETNLGGSMKNDKDEAD